MPIADDPPPPVAVPSPSAESRRSTGPETADRTAAPEKDPDRTGTTSRRRVLTGTALAGAATAATVTASTAAPPRDGSSADDRDGSGTDPVPAQKARRRAARATQALLTRFRAETDPDLLIERYPRQDDDPEFAYVWPLSQGRAAVTELIAALGSRRNGEATTPEEEHGSSEPVDLDEADAALIRAQERYWYPEGGTTGLPGYTAATDSQQGAHGDFYYDDNDWIALLEIEQHLLTEGRRGDLDRAVELLELFRSGEANDPALTSPGGIWWTQDEGNDDRNTVSTVPSAKVALRLHQITGDEETLADALRWMDWTRDTLLSPEGLYWDNIAPDGELDRTFWSYNQGVPLGAEALAFEITGEKSHRDNAFDLLDAVVEHYQVFEEGGELDDQPIQFNAILLSNLLMAESILGGRVRGSEITASYTRRLWANRRDPDTDLVIGSRETDVGTHLLDQAGFARSLALAALPRSSWRHLS